MKANVRGCLSVSAALAAITLLTTSFRTTGFDLRVPPWQTGTGFRISFDALPGSYYDIQASTNLLSWSVLRTLRADAASATWEETNGTAAARFYRVADWSGNMVVEGDVRSADGRGVPDSCPFCDILVSSSLDSSFTYTDSDGHYVLRTRAAAAATNLPFTLYFSKIGFRAHSAVVTNPTLPRLEIMSLAGPSNNDFTNRLVISGNETNHGDNTQADIEEHEPGMEPSVWYSFSAPEDGTLRFAIDTTEFLPLISVYKGESLPTLQPAERGTISNWVEWRIEVTRELTVYAGERLQIRVGALDHPVREISGGGFDWKARFEAGFPLILEAWNTNQGTIVTSPAPNAAGRYAPGTEVTMLANPAPNYIFTGWRGAITGSQPTMTVTMNEAKVVAGGFQLANGNYTNAIGLTGELVSAEAFVPLDSSVWYEWTAPRDMPIAIDWDTTNFLHGTVYRVDPEGLRFVANNHSFSYVSAPDHKDTRFWAIAGATYKVAVNFEANEMGLFRLRLYEPVVMRGAVSGGGYYTVHIFSSFTNQSFALQLRSFELWTRVPSTPDLFPYFVTVTSRLYRPTSGIVYSNTQSPIYSLTLAGPANNDFSNAMRVVTSDGSFSGTYIGTDREPGEPGLGGSLWYAFTPPTNGTYFITNNIRSTLEISGWEGEAVGALQAVRGVRHELTATAMTTEWTARADHTLYIRAGSTGGLPGSLSLQYRFVPDYPLYLGTDQPLSATLQVLPPSANGRYPGGATVTLTALPEPHYLFGGWTGDVMSIENPITFTMDSLKVERAWFWISNDAFSAAQALSGPLFSISGVNRYASAEPNEPNQGPWPAASSVWYRWTAPVGGSTEIEFDFTDVTIVATVFEGNSLGELVPVANNLAGRNVRRVAFTATAHQTYYISVDGYMGDGGPFAFTIQPVEEARYFLNILPAAGGYVERVPAEDGNAEYGAGTQVMLQTIPVNTSSFVGWEELTWGTPVSLGNAQTISVTMDRHRIVRPVFDTGIQRLHDNFSDRMILIADGGAVIATNVMATSESGEQKHATNGSGQSLWWSWTSPTLAPIAFTTFGSSFSNVVAVYRGSAVAGLELVAAGLPGLGSDVTFMGEAGITYHIAVDGIGGAAGVAHLRAVENEQFYAGILTPTKEQSWAEPALVPVRAQGINSELTVTQVNLFTNGTLAFSASGPVLECVLSNPPLGVLVLVATAMDGRGRTVTSEPVTNYVHGYRFFTNSVTAHKSNGVAQITIVRSPPYNFRSEVTFDVQPGTALPGIHYTPLRGAVLFHAGENTRNVFVPIPQSTPAPNVLAFYPRLVAANGVSILDSVTVTIANEPAVPETVWIDDAFPAGATTYGVFSWISTNPAPTSGSLARRASSQHSYSVPWSAGILRFPSGKVLWQDIYIDPLDPPALVGVRLPGYAGWNTVYWGDRSRIPSYETWLGPLPERGGWHQIAVPRYYLPPADVTFLMWITERGTAVWDRTGTW